MSATPPPVPPDRVVGVAYLISLLCLLVPLALVGSAFASVTLARRGRPLSAAGVTALGVACAAIGLTVIR